MWLLILRAAQEGFIFRVWISTCGQTQRPGFLAGVRPFYLGRRGQSRLEGAQFLLLFNQELETESEEKE